MTREFGNHCKQRAARHVCGRVAERTPLASGPAMHMATDLTR